MVPACLVVEHQTRVHDALFVLSEGLPAIPAKLIRKIQKSGFVDMAELLRDNMEVCRREEGTPKPSRRAIPDLLSWVTCFGAYASVVTEKQPERVKSQAYDSMSTNNSKVVWSQLNSSLYATSFLANQNQRGRTCPHCMETDHATLNCAQPLQRLHPRGGILDQGTQRGGRDVGGIRPVSTGTMASAPLRTVGSGMFVLHVGSPPILTSSARG